MSTAPGTSPLQRCSRSGTYSREEHMTDPNRPSTLQMFPWETLVAAVKGSAGFSTFEAFYADLADSLPQNSPETRRRIANLIARAYFTERSLNSLATRVWAAYRREDILTDIMRVMTLEAEPVIARFVLEHVLVLEPGSVFSAPSAPLPTATGSSPNGPTASS